MTTLYSVLSHLNSINNNSNKFNYSSQVKFVLFVPRTILFKFIQMVWGIQVFMFTIKMYISIMTNKHPDSIDFDLCEMWDCINDGWMRDYIYPYDNIHSKTPSQERVLRLGLNSFRPYFDYSINESSNNIKFDNGMSIDFNYDHPSEQDLDDWYYEDHSHDELNINSFNSDYES